MSNFVTAESIRAAQLIKSASMVAAERMRHDLRLFAMRAWPIVEPKPLQWNWHLDAIAEHLIAITLGEIRNLMICIPPRMSKTTMCSIIWPVWHWLHNAGTQFICASYEISLATEAAVASRRLIESGWYQQHFAGEYFLLPDENQKTLYRNSAGGYRVTTSVNGKTAGFGGDIQLLDDPHNTKDVESDTKRQNALVWHDNSWRSRMNDPNSAQKVYVAQRTHDADVMGHVMRAEGHRWVVLTLPMEHDPKRKCITYKNDGTGVAKGAKPLFEDPRQVEGELLNPKRFNAATAMTEKDAMSARAWNAQYQQQPEGEGGLILKRHWWRQWCYPEWHPEAGKVRPLPQFTEIIQVYDTAFEEKEENDYTARTTWGIFSFRETIYDVKTQHAKQGQQRVCALLLDMLCERLEYPELRTEALKSDEAFQADWILIEKKASGHSLIQELRRKGLPVKAVKVDGAGDLQARVKAASLMLEKGCIFYVPNAWSMRVIDSAAKFPVGEHDDIESTLSMAWMYMRQYYDLTLPDDEPVIEINPFKWQRQRRYA